MIISHKVSQNRRYIIIQKHQYVSINLVCRKDDKDQEGVCVQVRFGKGMWFVKYHTDVFWSDFGSKSEGGPIE